MANKIPVKAIYSGSDVTSLGEYASGDTIASSWLDLTAGTGVTISGSGVIAASSLALSTVQTAANQSAQLALTTQAGDIVVRSDENKTYCHNGGSAGSMADFTLLATPTDIVLSVAGNTGVVTNAHIAAAVEAASGSNTFTDADHTKLNAIEASADVTDATNVTAAGALMDSEVTNLAAVKSFAASDYATAAQGTLATNALPKAGGTMTGDLIMDANEIHLADNGEIRLGNAADLVIYHDGADSIIKDKGTGNLSLRTNGNFYVVNEASSEVLIRADVNGSVDLYYDNSKKFETTAAGVDVTGNIVVSGTVDGVDIATRDAILTSTTTTAGAALPKAGGTLTGQLTCTHIDLSAINTWIYGAGHKVIQVDATRTYYYGGSAGSQFRTADNSAATMDIFDNGNVSITGRVYSANGIFGVNDGHRMDMSSTRFDWEIGGAKEMRLEADGDLHVDGDVIAYSTTVSDETLKYNINPVEFALDKIKQLKGVTFNYFKDNKESAGLLAQDVEKVMPSAVTERKIPLHKDDDKSYKTLHYDSVTAILVEAIKELSAKVERLENK